MSTELPASKIASIFIAVVALLLNACSSQETEDLGSRRLNDVTLEEFEATRGEPDTEAALAIAKRLEEYCYDDCMADFGNEPWYEDEYTVNEVRQVTSSFAAMSDAELDETCDFFWSFDTDDELFDYLTGSDGADSSGHSMVYAIMDATRLVCDS